LVTIPTKVGIQTGWQIFSKYETSLERQIYKAAHELERLQRMRLVVLVGYPQDCPGLIPHMFGKLFYFAEFHYPCPAILDTGRLKTFGDALAAKIAFIGRKGEVVEFASRYFRFNLIQVYAPFSGWTVVLLFTGNLTGVAANAEFVVYQ
jgi:hypothetical protein